MEEQQRNDDIPMIDGTEASSGSSAANNTLSSSSSSAQRFSIVDVLGNDDSMNSSGGGISSDGKEGGSGNSATATIVPVPPDPMHSAMYDYDEGAVLQRLQMLYPYTDIQKLPRIWSKTDRWSLPQQNNNGTQQLPILELSADLLRVTKRKGTNQNSKDAAAVRANRPIPRSCIVYYFEITVVSKGQDGFMGIGLSEKNVSLNRLPGWDAISYGYHGDDGNFFSSSGKGVEYGPTFTTGDVIGCGLNFVTRQLFFTKNGHHLGVANALSIPLNNDLFPTMGMQTADEMIDANFGQKPFLFDMRSELKMAEKATMENIKQIELPAEKVLWMNSLVSNWMAHEGYSRALDALNRATGGSKTEPTQQLAKSDSHGSTITFDSKDSQSPTVAAEKVAEVVINSMIGLLGGNGDISTQQTGGSVRRSVVRSVQEALHEEMEQRRILVRMVKRGQLADAIDKIEQLFPSLLETNRQLALLIKTQHFIEMLREITKELPSLPQENQNNYQTHENNSLSTKNPSPRPSSSRGGKRSASAVDDDYTMIASSSNDEGKTLISSTDQHNQVKRRSSNEDNADQPQPQNSHSNQQQQNGNSTNAFTKRVDDDFMEFSEESRDGIGQSSSFICPATTLDVMSNGDARSNGCSLLVGTPPTSTTIIKEYDSGEFGAGNDDLANELELAMDGFQMEVGFDDNKNESSEYGGFANPEEQNQFSRYAPLLEFGQEISRFAMDNVGEDVGQQNCAALRHRMNAAFSLLCYRDPSQSANSYLFDQTQRDIVARALNAAIIESHGKDGTSPLEKCLSRARFIRDQALTFSASAVFTDANRLLLGESFDAGNDEKMEIPQVVDGEAAPTAFTVSPKTPNRHKETKKDL
ncbi:hypothetical protein ACQ4LE_006566 [Meloidogyne hapla]|uniref:Ran-binding protein n=1 Tax=Meloidogyne hapla TaxID=6305 RepID=A0A1I8BSH1_MELHA